MLYWLIPYLVAYNGSDTSDWKYGPEHHFKAEISSNATLPMDSGQLFADTTVDFTCRPIKTNSSFMQCRIDSTTVEKYELRTGSKLNMETKKKKRVDQFGMVNVVFEIEFEEKGIYKVELTVNDTHRINMIYAIIGTMHLGINLVNKTLQNYDSQEESMVGICSTSFNIGEKSSMENKEENMKVIDGFSFDVPLLSRQSNDATIIIEKNRNVSDCVQKTFYLFGTNNNRANRSKTGQQSETVITYSQSRMSLGHKSFSSYTENLGTMTHILRRKSGTTEIEVGEKIRVHLESIQPAKEELRRIKNVAAARKDVTSEPLLSPLLQ